MYNYSICLFVRGRNLYLLICILQRNIPFYGFDLRFQKIILTKYFLRAFTVQGILAIFYNNFFVYLIFLFQVISLLGNVSYAINIINVFHIVNFSN